MTIRHAMPLRIGKIKSFLSVYRTPQLLRARAKLLDSFSNMVDPWVKGNEHHLRLRSGRFPAKKTGKLKTCPTFLQQSNGLVSKRRRELLFLLMGEIAGD